VRSLCTSAREESGDSGRGARSAVQHAKSRANDDAKFVSDWHQIGDTADHRQNGKFGQDLAPSGVVLQESLRNLERKTTPREVWERIRRAAAVWIDEPIGGGRLWRNCMVVNDADGDPLVTRRAHLRNITRTAVNSEEKLDAVLERGDDGSLRDSMSVRCALRDITFGDRTYLAKGADDNRRTSQTICVKVTNNEDGLPRFARCFKARDQSRSIGEEARVMQRSVAGVKESLRNLR